jgi:hypothetical protein
LSGEWFAQVAQRRRKPLLVPIHGEKERVMLQKAKLGN